MANASKLVAQALELADATAKTLARRMKISSSSLRKYGYGTRTPTSPLLHQLARILREQARELNRVSDAIAKFAAKQGKALRLQRRPGGRRRKRR